MDLYVFTYNWTPLNTEGMEGFSSSLILLLLIWSYVTEQLKKSSFGKK